MELSEDGKQATVIVRRFSYLALLNGATALGAMGVAAAAGVSTDGGDNTRLANQAIAAAGGYALCALINQLVTARTTTVQREPYKTCIDRPFVQLEIRTAIRNKKNIITVFEEDKRRQGYFDYALAWDKYGATTFHGATEWKFLLDIDSITYRRQAREAQAMINRIIDRAVPWVGEPQWQQGRPLNQPGCWDFFLSHGQAAAGDQVKTLCLLLRQRQKPDGTHYRIWYDNEMITCSTPAMQEGVVNSANVILFLSGDPDLGD